MAAEIIYTDNPSDYLQLEALYVTEKPPAGAIEGADLNRVGMGGICVRGPEEVVIVASSEDFVAWYGERDYEDGGALVSEVWAARVAKAYGITMVRRVVAVDATTASLNFEEGVDGTGTEIIKVAASSRGEWAAGGRLRVQIKDASDGVATKFNLEVLYRGVISVYENLDTSVGKDNLAEVIGDELDVLVTVTKLADGRPANSSTVTEPDFVAARNTDGYVLIGNINDALALWTGVDADDGTPVSADYLAAINELAAFEGVALAFIAGASVDQNALNGQIAVLAAAASTLAFATWSGTHGQSRATEITNAGTDFPTRSDRVNWCFNSEWKRDPISGLLIQRGPHEHMASLYSQTEVDTHIGAKPAAKFGSGIVKLTNQSLSGGDLKLLKAAGICTLEKVKAGFLFRSGVTMSLDTGRKQIAQRRMRDFLQISAAEELSDFVKAKGTTTNQIMVGAMLINFSQNLKDEERVVQAFEVNQTGVNTKSSRAKQIEKILWRVQTLGHWLALVLETEIGVGVTITEE